MRFEQVLILDSKPDRILAVLGLRKGSLVLLRGQFRISPAAPERLCPPGRAGVGCGWDETFRMVLLDMAVPRLTHAKLDFQKSDNGYWSITVHPPRQEPQLLSVTRLGAFSAVFLILAFFMRERHGYFLSERRCLPVHEMHPNTRS